MSISLASGVFVGPAEGAVVQHGDVRAGFTAAIAPRHLPRNGSAPIGVSMAVSLAGVHGPPPLLRSISIAINRVGRLQATGLPRCTVAQVQPTTDADALRACGDALVGEGEFSAQVGLTGQSPFPARGKVLAFNGTEHGRSAILLHVYGTEPVPTSYTFPLLIGRTKGTFGTTLRAVLPETTGTSGYITALSLSLRRTYSSHGESRSYLLASCPAPEGFPGAVFPLARTRLGFNDGARIATVVTGHCMALG